MLTRLSRILDVVRAESAAAERSGSSGDTESESRTYSIDIYALRLRGLVPFQSAGFPWARITGACGEVCRGVHDMLLDDAERVERLMKELEVDSQEEEEENVAESDVLVGSEQDLSSSPAAVCGPVNVCYKRGVPPPGSRRAHHRKRRRPKQLEHPLLIPSPHPSAPSILITPCPTVRSSSSWVPLQDASFGNKLVVPGYPLFNSSRLAFVAKPGHSRISLTESLRWKWRDGCWHAVVPDVEAQVRKGWFSRPINAKRRAGRPATSHQGVALSESGDVDKRL